MASETGLPGGREFPSTSWSALRQLRDPEAPEYRGQLERLARLYWKPVYCVIRSRWARTDADAKDLTQEFFSRALLDGDLFRSFSPERGSFRGFLRGALANFMNNVFRDAGRLKRGGGVRLLSLDGDLPTGEVLDVASDRPPEEMFDQLWDEVVVEHALGALAAQLRAAGKADHYEAFQRYDLAPETSLSYEELGPAFGWNARKVKRVLTETRAAFRDLLTAVVKGYVDGPEELTVELRRLLGR